MSGSTLFNSSGPVLLKLLFLSTLLVLAVTCDEDIADDQLEDICNKAASYGCNYQAWKKAYGVSYDSPKEDRRHRMQYCENCIFTKSHQGSYTMKMGEDAAMNQDEILAYRSLVKREKKDDHMKAPKKNVDKRRLNAVNLPASLDYSNYNGANCIGAIKKQGTCRDSWAFAATALYESMLCINGFNYNLSEEATLECTTHEAPNARVNDCLRGYLDDPLHYFSNRGGVLASDYPYVAGGYGRSRGTPLVGGICTDSSRIFLGQGSVSTYGSPSLTVTEIKDLLFANGPLVVGIYTNTAFNFYHTGVFDGCPSYSYYYVDHSVLLYGWDSNGNWLIKNSWGTGWGINGTMILSSVYDCGISSDLAQINIPVKNTNVQVTMNITY